MKKAYWITRMNGRVMGAISEEHMSDAEILAALKEFTSDGQPVERIFSDHGVTIGSPL